MSTIGSLSDDEIKILFSRERLNRLAEIYEVDGSVLILIHEALNELGGSIFSSLSIFEVNFRNLICLRLEQLFGEEWFEHAVFQEGQPYTDHKTGERKVGKNRLKGAVGKAKNHAKKNAYSKLSAEDRRDLRNAITQDVSKREKDNKVRKDLIVSNGDIVSCFYISFWRTLFSKTYEPQLWNYGLRDIFTERDMMRGEVSKNLETVYKVRNRIAHHEFIHPKLCRTYLESIKFLTNNLRLDGHLGTGKVYKFQEPYIKKIEFQLSQLEHILGTLRV